MYLAGVYIHTHIRTRHITVRPNPHPNDMPTLRPSRTAGRYATSRRPLLQQVSSPATLSVSVNARPRYCNFSRLRSESADY